MQNITQKYQILKSVFGFENFRPGQEEIIDALLAGSHTLAVMPTGAGKSLCFQLPALVFGGVTIVVSPLVALMQNQVAALELAGVNAQAIHSARTRAENIETWHAVKAGEVRLLYMAPERLMNERMLTAISNLPLSMFVIDEAHCISSWGPAFRPEYAQLSMLNERFPDIPIAALTATADETTRRDIAMQLFATDSRTFVSGFDRPNIAITVKQKSGWKGQLADFMKTRRGQSGIVYCLSRKKTEATAALLCAEGFNALAYHAGLDKSLRSHHLDRFITEPGLVMVATIAFGMGIDKPDIRYVFHVDLPASIEAYYQEIGRAGRDGAPADVMMLYGAGDIALRRRFIENEDSDETRKLREHKRLDVFIAYCDAITCRRVILLDYFGENSNPCGNCDICANPVELVDGSENARLVLAAIFDTGQRFGQAHIIDILRGANSEKIRKFNHDKITVYAEGRDLSKTRWQGLIRQMISGGLLKIDVSGYGALHVSEPGREVARGNKPFLCRPEIEQPVIAATPRRKSKSARGSIELSTRDEELLHQLKKLRLELARARKVPAYVIFPDKTLIDMAMRRPSSQDEFEQVKGVGKAKLKQFAALFLKVVSDS